VPEQRRLRILSLLFNKGANFQTARLCEVCAEVTSMSGAGIMLMFEDAPQGTVCTTNDVSSQLEQLQYTLGEGPCVDAYREDRPVLEPNLANPDTKRWLAFSEAAVKIGAQAVFGFPLQVGAVRLGALNLYRDQPGALDEEQYDNALASAAIVAQAVLVLQANAPNGMLAQELERSSDFQLVVHQAAGMVAVQMNVSVTEAMIRLRAYAFGNERKLSDVAGNVVNRTLRFDSVAGPGLS
jgi:GAF domain